MKKIELQNRIEELHRELKSYRDLLSESRDAMVRIVRNGPKLEEMRGSLNRKYGGLSRYIKKLGNYPMRSDIGGGPYPAYETALSNDILQRRGPCIDAAIQDLEYIIGRLEDISENELNSIFMPHQSETKNEKITAYTGGGGGGGGGLGGGRGGDGGSVKVGILPEQITIAHVKNPHSQYWKFIFQRFIKFLKTHKFLSGSAIIAILLLIGALTGYVHYEPIFSNILGTFTVGENKTDTVTDTESQDLDSERLDRSIFDLSEKTIRAGLTSKERVDLIANISGLETIEENGVIVDIGSGGLTLLIREDIDDGYVGRIQCDFAASWKQRISLLEQGSKIKFLGTISRYDLSQQWIILEDCKLPIVK